jgi:hypothetical protein
MFEHIGMLALIPGTTPEQLSRIVSGLQDLPRTVATLQSATVSSDAGLSPGNASLIFTMTFKDRAGWESYKTHPDHVAVIRDRIAPFLDTKLFVQVDRCAPVRP